MIIEGSISVKAVLLSGSRQIKALFIENKKRNKDISFIIREAQKRDINISFLENDSFTALVNGRTHGGIAAEVGERTYEDPEKLFSADNPFIALLEGIEDPYNFGDSIRSLYAAGATGLIIPKRNWMDAAETVVRASAGASEYIPTASCEDLGEAIILSKKYGIKTFCANRRNAKPIGEEDFTCPVIIAIGGELRGLSRKVTDNSDGNVFIPYGSDFRNALSASAASAVCAFEIMRQRQNKDVG